MACHNRSGASYDRETLGMWIRVNRTGGTSSETVVTGPETLGTGLDRFQTGPIQSWIWIQKMEKSHKVLKNTSRCVEFNGVKNFQISVRLV
jgi:hypothetical protein